jgi:hypothetical protein
MSAAVLDQALGSPPLDPSPGAAANALRAAGIRANCLELGDRSTASEAGPPSTAGEALKAVVRADPRYRWEVTNAGLLDLYPTPSVLDDAVPALSVAGKGLWTVLESDLGLADHGIELFMELRDGDGPPVPDDLPAGTLRAALDRLVAPVDQTVWHITGNPGAFFLTVSAIG